MRESQNQAAGNSSVNIDEPPMSRLFVVCDKSITEENLRDAFQEYGTIEYIWVIKDKQTQQNKGIAYVKFQKTSEAANAQEALDDAPIGSSDRPLKVLVAANPKQDGTKSDNDNEKYVRLFVTLPKTVTENEVIRDFSKYGEVEKVTIVKDRNTNEAKGFGYVKFAKFSHTAIAFENCPAKYHAVFAEPKPQKRNFQNPQEARGTNDQSKNKDGSFGAAHSAKAFSNAFSNMSHESSPTALEVHCSNTLTQDQIWRLFDVIPGLDYCKIDEAGARSSVASVVYKNPEAAAYAQEKFHGFEYPIGERLIVKADSNPKFDHLKGEICSVELPPPMETAPLDSPVAIRLFIILSANIPQASLKNIFCRFPGLIDAYLLSNKNCGYVKYAKNESGIKAMSLLNGADIYGCKLKIVEADDPPRESATEVKRSRKN